MATELNIPNELHETRDAVISGFFDGHVDPKAESALANWLLLFDTAFCQRFVNGKIGSK